VVPRGEGIGLTVIQWASALLFNGLGRHEEALVVGLEASADPRELAVGNWGLAEVVEAAVRTGETRRAFGALEQLAAMTQACGTSWALGVEARSRALVSGRSAEDHHQRAIALLGDTHVRVDQARAHLLYGEFLRRQDRRTLAREQLRTAHQMFSSMGLAAFAERSRLELLRCGESVRSSRRVRSAELTLQEARIARLAGEGLTNPEIGAQLFLSPHTVDWHLRKVFSKLGISSRRQIAERLPQEVRVETDG
jgi:DNA-binding CsgD family transcriptional regulator